MRRLAKIVAVFAAFGTMTALAAPDAPPAPVTSAAPAPSKVMSVGEMNVSAASLEARIEEDSQQVLHLQEIAKKQKDVIKLNCVNDRLVQVKAQRNIADETHAQLGAALAKNSDERIGLYSQFSATADSIKDLREQAKACIGEPELLKQESGVVVDHPLLPDDPTITLPTEGGSIGTFEPPVFASPFD